MHTITIDGYEYAAEALAARAEMFSAYARTRELRAAGRDPGMAGFMVSELAFVVEAQLDDIHLVSYGACSCGLVTDDVTILGGHRNLRDTSLAGAFVAQLVDSDVYGAACQHCLWSSPPGTREETFAASDQHACR
jgi:hypothetical protein